MWTTTAGDLGRRRFKVGGSSILSSLGGLSFMDVLGSWESFKQREWRGRGTSPLRVRGCPEQEGEAASRGFVPSLYQCGVQESGSQGLKDGHHLG